MGAESGSCFMKKHNAKFKDSLSFTMETKKLKKFPSSDYRMPSLTLTSRENSNGQQL